MYDTFIWLCKVSNKKTVPDIKKKIPPFNQIRNGLETSWKMMKDIYKYCVSLKIEEGTSINRNTKKGV